MSLAALLPDRWTPCAQILPPSCGNPQQPAKCIWRKYLWEVSPAKAQKAATASTTSTNGKKQSVFSKGADFLAKNGDKVSGALNSAAQKLSKKGAQNQSNPQVARTTTTGTVASAAQMNELARRKKMMGL